MKLRSSGKRPKLPYGPEFKVNITRHRPPYPFGREYKAEYHRQTLEDEELFKVDLRNHVIQYPVIETNPVDEGATAELTIEKRLRVGDNVKAQIITCTVVPQRGEPYHAVAKIFDPLYHPSADDSLQPLDITREADKEYSFEATSYEVLDRDGLTGTLVPKYYGSWTFSLDIPDEKSTSQRSIRLVLIEYLDGCTIHDLVCGYNGPKVDKVSLPRVDSLDEEYRLDVMARGLDALTRLAHSGVIHAVSTCLLLIYRKYMRQMNTDKVITCPLT
ncbi:hypothetical protein GGR57DRAFT_509173 [Xylariaceae sp. FL1272]|nr:hypothetical protein GGR57DRAFT_509173 [Xylariaceae sp. FL1272]